MASNPSPSMKNIFSYSTMPTLPQPTPFKSSALSRLTSIIQQPYTDSKSTQLLPKKFQSQNPYSLKWWVILSKLIVILTINWYFIVLGFAIPFGTQWLNKTSDMIAIGVIVIMVFVSDIGVNMMRRMYCDRSWDMNWSNVKEYLKTFEFMVSVGMIIPVVVYTSYPHVYTLCAQPLFFISLFKIKDYKQAIFLKLSPYTILTYLFHSLNIILIILLTTHYLATFYILFDEQLRNHNVYGSQKQFWMSNNDTYDFDITNSEWYIKYLFAQFFSLGTWTLIAPGPTPKNPFQTVYTTLVMVFYIIVASKIVDKIIDMVGQQNQKKLEKKSVSDLLQDVMRAKGVKKPIRQRIQNYYQTIYQIQKDHLVVKQQISDLPIKMQADIGRQFLNISQIKWLKQLTFNKQKLVKQIFEITFDKIVEAGDYIINQNQNSQRVMYKCERQSVLFSCLYGVRNQKVNEIRVNDEEIVGGYEMVTRREYSYDAMMLKSCIISGIKRDEFVRVMKEEECYQKFLQIKDRLLLFSEFDHKKQQNQQYQQTKLVKCLFCGGEHNLCHCKNVYFNQRVKQQYWVAENENVKFNRSGLRSRKLRGPMRRNNRMIRLRRINSFMEYRSEDIDTLKRMKEYFVEYNL